MPKEEQKTTLTEAEKLQKTVEELTAQLQAEQKIKQDVLSDPDMRKVLEAKQKGEQLSIQVGQQPTNQEPSLKDKLGIVGEEKTAEDINSLDNAGILNLVIDAIEEYVPSRIGDALSDIDTQVDAKLTGVVKTQEEIKNAIVTQAKNTSSMQMGSKYPDFMDYANDAWKLVQTKGLSLEDAYLLTKSKYVAENPGADINTERPQIPSSREIGPRDRGENSANEQLPSRTRTTGRDFRNSISKAFDRSAKGRSGGL
jgi:hypothetical protein